MNWLAGNNFNILAFAGLLAIATTVGGVLLTDAIDLGESGVKEGVSGATAQLAQLTSAPDSGTNTKLLLEVVVVLFGVTALAVGKHSNRPMMRCNRCASALCGYVQQSQ